MSDACLDFVVEVLVTQLRSWSQHCKTNADSKKATLQGKLRHMTMFYACHYGAKVRWYLDRKIIFEPPHPRMNIRVRLWFQAQYHDLLLDVPRYFEFVKLLHQKQTQGTELSSDHKKTSKSDTLHWPNPFCNSF